MGILDDLRRIKSTLKPPETQMPVFLLHAQGADEDAIQTARDETRRVHEQAGRRILLVEFKL